MGRRGTGTVEPLKTAIRLKFTWRGGRRVETLDLAPTPANIKAAERLMAKVQAAIDNNVYDPAVYFPTTHTAPVHGFREYAEAWLKTLTHAKSTKRAYRLAMSGIWIPAFGDKSLAEIRYSDVKAAVAAKAATASGKTVNNALIPLRKVFEAAVLDKLIADSPAGGVANLAHQRVPPDPFEVDEVDAILAHMLKAFGEEVADYYAFAFLTGLRPSEQISARWSEVAFNRKKLRINRAMVDYEEKGTKTNRIRDVDLSDPAMAILLRQKARTFMKGLDAPIFENPETKKPWADHQTQRRRYFTPTLRKLGLRLRDAYQTRHTFATTALMGGINVAYISRQMGHASIVTTLNTYAQWIDDADKGAEAEKMNALLSRKRPRAQAGD